MASSSAAVELVAAIRMARAEGKSEAVVQVMVRRMADQYSTGELLSARAALEAELARGSG